MTATFGKLQGQTLELKDGLNIIQAPNETGKSTWCAFLLSMLYGINSRERDKAGYIAEKNRFTPWNGIPMSGRMDCYAQNAELTLTRTTKRQNAPMGEFQAVYAGTGNSVPNLTGQTCGEQLLGVSRDVFERSAFIRQAGLAISQDAGLERRIAALITSGEEDTSYSEAVEALKKQLNRRRHNKTGQIPALESELTALQQQLATLDQLTGQLSSAQAQIEQLSAQELALTRELEQYDQWALWQRVQDCARVEEHAQQLQQEADLLRKRLLEDRIPENDAIGRLRGALVNLETTRKSVEKARAERDEAMKALLRAEAVVNESPFAGQTAEGAYKEASEPPKVRPNLVASILIAFALYAVLAGAMYALHQPFGIYAAALVAVAVQLFLASRAKKKARDAALIKRFRTSVPEEISALAEKYAELLKIRDAAQTEVDQLSAAANTLYNTVSSNEQAILLEIRRFAPEAFNVSAADQLLRECAAKRKTLSEAESAAAAARLKADLLAQQTPPLPVSEQPPAPPARSREAMFTELSLRRSELAAARSTADRLTGQLQTIGDPVVLQSSAANTADRIAALEAEFSAIQMALATLDNANTALQNRFSPALGKRAAEIFGALTENRYSSVVLDRALHLFAEPTGDNIYRNAQLLSSGAVDQLYLATRLAICELVLPDTDKAPIVLDDALANFDDQRCRVALQWLKQEASKRQILLFTCHSREAAFFAGDSEVSIQQLTSTP